MNQDSAPSPESLGVMIITEVLERWPATVDVFHANGMACVGCAVAPFFTVFDAAVVYHLSPDAFVAQLMQVIDGERTTDDGPRTTAY